MFAVDNMGDCADLYLPGPLGMDESENESVDTTPAPEPAAVREEPKKKNKWELQNEKDKILSQKMVEQFSADVAKQSKAWKLFSDLFRCPSPAIHQVRPIADVFSRITGEYFPREAQRRKLPLMRWCEEHITDLETFLQNVEIVLETGDILRYARNNAGHHAQLQ